MAALDTLLRIVLIGAGFFGVFCLCAVVELAVANRKGTRRYE